MEFLRYPHLIHHLFNGGWFGPPWRFTATSTWTWIGHPVSGHMKQTMRPFQTRFPFGSGPEVLNLACSIYSPDRSTKSTRSPVDGLSVLVSTGFQVLFHSPPGVLFTYTTLTSFGGPSHALRLRFRNANRSPQPREYFYSRFGLCRVRSPLLAVSRLISFPRPT